MDAPPVAYLPELGPNSFISTRRPFEAWYGGRHASGGNKTHTGTMNRRSPRKIWEGMGSGRGEDKHPESTG
eukprot:3151079-Pyramimonas_sp.AAC.1